MNHIDHIFVINLDTRKDRLDEFFVECGKVNMDLTKVERFSAIPRSDHPCVGCTLSHLEVVKLAKQRGYKNVLIFEDDFQFLVSEETFYKNLSEFFEMNLPFRVVMLAYCCDHPMVDIHRVNDLISYTTNSSNAAAYIVNESCYDELIEWLTYGSVHLERTGQHWNYINDQIWKKLQGDKWFVFNERMGKQRPSYSDLSNRFIYPET